MRSVAKDNVRRSAPSDKVKTSNMRGKKLQLDIEKIEDIVADRLAEILIMQLDWQKMRAQEQAKNKYEKKDEKQIHHE